MLNKDQASDIFDRIRKLSSADEVEALFYGGHSALTRFANNTIHQNVDEDNVTGSVRTSFGGRTARASTNKFDEESLKRVVRAAESLARVEEPDADLLPMAGAAVAGEGARAARYFERTAAVTPELRADAVAKMVGVAKKNDLATAGIVSSAESIAGVFNSRGVAQWHSQTSSEISITMLARDSSGWQKANSPDDGEGVTRQRVQLVEKGVVKPLVYARGTAERMKKSEYNFALDPTEAT